MYDELMEPLYHGSTVKVDAVNVSIGAAGKDFGQGFYTTTSRIQAEKFAIMKAKRLKADKGIVSVFQYIHSSETKVKKFDKANIEWLLFILNNRGFKSKQNLASESADIIIGPVANDAVGLVLNQLLIGTYGDPGSEEARSTAIRLLETENLYNQVFFGTPQAVSCLQFREAFEIEIN